jgi:predicted NAD/FAD-dependent oxidoreductase
VYLTTPGHVTAKLLGGGEAPLLPDAAAALANISYPPVASVTLAYPSDAFKV